jgi:hypothetical protein
MEEGVLAQLNALLHTKDAEIKRLRDERESCQFFVFHTHQCVVIQGCCAAAGISHVLFLLSDSSLLLCSASPQ